MPWKITPKNFPSFLFTPTLTLPPAYREAGIKGEEIGLGMMVAFSPLKMVWIIQT